ncbi:unnamed protein product [Meganyctiphanes norvegica]|uniref:C-type lectin domain-containing protein n=1 Tax=Meganyctiphanes norvegica TaxID=48144 RepID=A0AAV2QNL9_MEGNR
MAEMCSRNYNKIGDECFVFSKDVGNWTMAQEACSQQGDILAAPRDMNTFLGHIESQGHLYAHPVYFVGGYKDPGADWIWQGQNVVNLPNEYWAKGNLGIAQNAKSSHCTAVWPEKYGLLKWNCSNSIKYICQKPDIPDHLQSNTCYTIPIFATIIVLLMCLIVGLSIYAYIVRRRFQLSVSTNKAPVQSVRCPLRHDSENSLYGQL